jgi:prephenate dehydratase
LPLATSLLQAPAARRRSPRPEPEHSANKASLAFVTRNEPGALLGCLEVFAQAGLNLTRLESRPTGAALWEYTFYADLEAQGRGELGDAAVTAVIDALALRANDIRLLGRYPRSTCVRSRSATS